MTALETMFVVKGRVSMSAKMKAALPESVVKFLRTTSGPWDAPLSGPAMPRGPASAHPTRL